ncbi:unnamed protein product [Zymoseptoria tritici ST99CH_3D7]|uniref:alpha-amylase n=2 Tax=Zymoseptoria tritici TaxID=1047171 RepID=F9WZU9_ZYMTI|nr:putative alpha-amylase [Zymoseptoria tritici IPO323]EGP92563.1 putative alpha-amylase [Zymoseptoria tritici IPO323]SMQ45384.1 unnamed protein product [Zymoseptoria tritici ST99CH_3D7]
MQVLNLIVLLLFTLCEAVLAANGPEWRSRTIYQVVTDRFALTNGSTTTACDTGLGLYCGGTWAGITQRLDYIQDMGFDAVWISPVTKQLDGNSIDGTSYHGYWQTNINEVNSAFGSEDDLRNLAAALHSRGMYLMVDIVVNHMAAHGPPEDVDYSVFTPFNDPSQYHSYCTIDYTDYTDDANIEQCWMGSTNVPLPDLRTEDSAVASQWNTWISNLVSDYSIDGLRIDSLMQVNRNFWGSFMSAAGVYAVGEAYIIDNDFVCGFQDYVPGVMNYMIYQPLVDAFKSTSGSISGLVDAVTVLKAGACKDTSLLGTFSENHDQPRFAALNGDMASAKNVIAFTMLTDGIPIIYQGQEQHYNALGGSSTPFNREALWLSGYNKDAELYKHVKTMNAIRKNAISDDSSYLSYQNNAVWSDSNNIAMRKGSMLAVLTNSGSGAGNTTLSIPAGYEDGVQVTELLTCTTATSSDGNLSVPMSGGAPRIYYPSVGIAGAGLCGASNTTLKSKLKLRNSRLFHLDY